jgi:hypothetical protein
VEPEVADAIRAHTGHSALAPVDAGQPPEGAAAVLAPLPDGACPAFDRSGGNLCSIQRALGHERLPASCRHFPRVALLEQDAIRVTLSHFCPTAASMLFRPDVGRPAVLHDAAGIADRNEHEGFDARHTIPPLLRPGVAMDGGTCRLWEHYLLDSFDRDGRTPEGGLAAAALAAEQIRGWVAGQESLEAHARRVLLAAEAAFNHGGGWHMTFPGASRLHQSAADSVPPGLAAAAPQARPDEADRAWVAPRWAAFSRPLGRYLAARSFAAWSAYQGQGLRTQVAMLAVALAVVRVEAARGAARASRPLDDTLLHAAIRAADLLLHHLSDSQRLVRRHAGVERGPAAAFLDAIGLEAAG